MITSQTAAAVGSEFFPLKRTLLGKAGASSGDAPTKKDLLAALGQSSEGDAVGATDKVSRALSKLDGSAEAGKAFADAVAPFLRQWQLDGQGTAPRDGGLIDGRAAFAPALEASSAAAQGEMNGDGRFPSAGAGPRDPLAAGANPTSADLPAGRLNSQMLAVLLQHQAA